MNDIEMWLNAELAMYLGDGNYRKGINNTLKSEAVRLAMYFDGVGRKRLIDLLNEVGIYATEQGKQIYINANSRKLFFRYMNTNNIPLSYQYKFPQGVII